MKKDPGYSYELQGLKYSPAGNARCVEKTVRHVYTVYIFISGFLLHLKKPWVKQSHILGSLGLSNHVSWEVGKGVYTCASLTNWVDYFRTTDAFQIKFGNCQ